MTDASTHSTDCVFCQAQISDSQLILLHGDLCFVILNLYPYNNGHLMVVPKRHVATLATTTPEELSELMRLTRDAEIALTEAYRPQGINVGLNLGRAAGAGVLEHLHIHMVPRWNGDTNFMSVVADTRVLPEDLAGTATRLRPIFERLWAAGPASVATPAAPETPAVGTPAAETPAAGTLTVGTLTVGTPARSK